MLARPRPRALAAAVLAGLPGLVVLLCLAVLVAPLAAVAPASAAPGGAVAGPTDPADPAQVALEQAEAFHAGELAPSARLPLLARVLGDRLPRRASSAEHVEATMVMRDLWRTSDDLAGADRVRAEQLLARPTDGASDPAGDGWTTPSQRTCSPRVCVHWVEQGADAPPDRAWVARTLKVMDKVWRREVGTLGYRAPLPDGTRGGDSRFDVYLQDLGSTGAYGYCTPDGSPVRPARAAPGAPTTAAGYCVLDNDFSAAQYVGAKPLTSLRVTAAHEFFHAVQFAYDATEDPWFMESTAVWMEERAAGGANDNRQYLRYGQLVDPAGPLDHFESSGFTQYGNWPWWEYLSQRFGTGIVQQVWKRAAGTGGASWSSAAMRKVLASRGGLPQVFADYASATTDAARAYREGAAWPAPATAGDQRLSAEQPRARPTASIDHLASASYVYLPDRASLSARGVKLRVTVQGPRRSSRPAAAVRVLRTDGRVTSRAVPLDASGRGRTTVPFGAQKIARVTVTLANVSTRFRCWRGAPTWSCQGKPRDDDQPFRLAVRAVLP